VKTFPTRGRASHMLALSARGDRIATANIADHTITLLSLAPAAEPRVIPVGRQPEGIALSPDGRTVWAGSNRDSVVLTVNAATGAVTDTIHGFGLPYRIAISRNGRLAVITDPVMATVRGFDATTRDERFTIAVPRDSLVPTAEVPGSPSPEGVAISTDSRFAFVTLQGRNRVITIDLERGAIIGWAPTGTWSDGIAYSSVVPRPR
jgi:YVTN family beta-propeller protein